MVQIKDTAVFSFCGLKYAFVHEHNMRVSERVCGAFYLVLLTLSADLSQALECECEKHAFTVSLSSASQPSECTYTHTPLYMLICCVCVCDSHMHTQTFSSLHLMSVLADPCQL